LTVDTRPLKRRLPPKSLHQEARRQDVARPQAVSGESVPLRLTAAKALEYLNMGSTIWTLL
jgi:hypothetical protein